MQCPSCAGVCTEVARFCHQCGTDLKPRCTTCGQQLVVSARFCHQCGTPVSSREPAPPVVRDRFAPWIGAMEGEKRLGTILFADMSDSVALTRDLHPEDALSLVNQLLQVMTEAIFANGGRVNRFLGDGALAVFGITRAQESDPERAILAALQIREAAHKLGLDVTVGINTGEVYAGGIGTERYQEQTVIGSVVNLAARLQSHAGPGEILVGETTYRLACRAFSFRPRVIEAKGIPEPVTAYSVEGPRVRPQNRNTGTGRLAPLVGRDHELEELLDAARAAAGGKGQVVAISGDPGVGKSRLLSELRRKLPASPSPEFPDGYAWLDGRCLEFSESVGYWPFVDLLHQWLDWSPEDSDALRHGRIVRRLWDLRRDDLIDDEEQQALFSTLGSLLSVRITGAVESGRQAVPPRHEIFHCLRRLLLALARRKPLVVALEDLHWADSLSLDFLGFLLDSIPEAPILLVVTHRVEGDHSCRRFAAQAARKCPDRLREFRLSELGPEESFRLAASLLGTEALSPSVQEVLQRNCYGNPMFVEEVVRSMTDSGALYRGPEGWQVAEAPDTVRTPESIQSVILSRVDRLPPDLRQLLQYASVLGPVFRPRLLEHLGMDTERLRKGLAQLTEAGLVRVEKTLPEEEYAFKHALTRETIYETILRRTRKRLHAAVAETLESQYAGHLEDLYAELGRHYSLGDENGRAARYFVRAGQRAKRLFANREAGKHFERALRCLARLAPDEETRVLELEALEGLGDVGFRLGAHHTAEVHFSQARDQVAPTRDPDRFARLSWKLADAVHWQGEYRRAIEIAEQGLAAGAEGQSTPAAACLLEVIMRSHWAAEDLVSARRRGEQLEAILPGVPYFDSLYMIHYGLAWLEIKWKQFDRGRYWLETMRQTCEQNHDAIGLARCLHGLGDLCRAQKDFEGAADWFARSVEICERTGDAHLLMEGYLEWAQVLIMLGRPEAEAEPLIRKGMALAEEMAAAGGVSSIQSQCSALGRAFHQQGNVPRALYFFEKSFDFGENPTAEITLSAMRPLYEQEGRLADFAEFCARVGHAPPLAATAQ